MKTKGFRGEVFTVEANNRTYYVEPICETGECMRFQISTQCEYMFTIYTDKEGDWHVENDVAILDKSLVEHLGRAIEYNNGY